MTGSHWGPQTFGEPCRGCGHDRSLTTAGSIALVRSIPDRFESVLAGCTGDERHPDLVWSSGDYVGHVVDNLRFDHPDRGELSVADIVSTNSHDAVHHFWDIARTVTASRSRLGSATR